MYHETGSKEKLGLGLGLLRKQKCILKQVLRRFWIYKVATGNFVCTVHLKKLRFGIETGEETNQKTLVAISEVTKRVLKEDPYFFNIKPPVNYTRLLVISLGTGSDTSEIKFDAKKASKWGLICWLYEDGTSPLIDVYSQGSSDLVDYLNSVVFKATQSENNYLRINDDTLKGTLSSVDTSTKENLEDLVKVGESLLKKPVSRVNLNTGRYEPLPNAGTNEEALKRFAKLLSYEKKLRESRSLHDMRGE